MTELLQHGSLKMVAVIVGSWTMVSVLLGVAVGRALNRLEHTLVPVSSSG